MNLQQQLKAIEKKLQKPINDCLRNEVASHVKEEISKAVKTEVYDAGIPAKYVRRGEGGFLGSGSLGDPDEMNIKVLNMRLMVTDDAFRNFGFLLHPGYGYDDTKTLVENITYGYGDRNTWYNEPRPFISVARENIRQKNSHVETMRNGLKKRLGSDNVK